MSTKLALADCVFSGSNEIIDTHVHYNLSPLVNDWQAQWQKAQASGVTQSVIAGTNLADSQVAVDIANEASGLWALVGVHPSEVATADVDTAIPTLGKLLQQEKVLGLGEIGLDYYWLQPGEREQVPLQQQWLRAQLELARQQGGWVTLHVRDRDLPAQRAEGNAYWDTYSLMREFDWSNQPFILHCVSGPLPYIQAMLDLGAYIGFDGNITYPKADELRAILDLVPRDRLLIETDAPYLPPQSHRGQQCEPWMIGETAEWVQNYLDQTRD